MISIISNYDLLKTKNFNIYHHIYNTVSQSKYVFFYIFYTRSTSIASNNIGDICNIETIVLKIECMDNL